MPRKRWPFPPGQPAGATHSDRASCPPIQPYRVSPDANAHITEWSNAPCASSAPPGCAQGVSPMDEISSFPYYIQTIDISCSYLEFFHTTGYFDLIPIPARLYSASACFCASAMISFPAPENSALNPIMGASIKILS